MPSSLELTYDVIGKLSRAATAQDICDGLTSFTGRYGLTAMMAASLPAPNERASLMRRRHLLVGAFPPGWMDHYFKQGYAHIDPVVSRSKHDLSPFLWSECAPSRAPSTTRLSAGCSGRPVSSISRRGSWCR